MQPLPPQLELPKGDRFTMPTVSAVREMVLRHRCRRWRLAGAREALGCTPGRAETSWNRQLDRILLAVPPSRPPRAARFERDSSLRSAPAHGSGVTAGR